MKSSDLQGNRAELCAWLSNEDPDGFQGHAPKIPSRYELLLPTCDPANFAVAAEADRALSLAVSGALLRDDSGIEPSNVLRSHVAVCRFLDFDAEDVAGLDLRPDFVVALDRTTWCLWGLTEPASLDELVQLQEDLRDGFGGDPEWDASPVELVPLPGVLYPVGNAEVEAVELEVPA